MGASLNVVKVDHDIDLTASTTLHESFIDLIAPKPDIVIMRSRVVPDHL